MKKYGSVRQIHHLLSHIIMDLLRLVYMLTTVLRRITIVYILSCVNEEHYNTYTIHNINDKYEANQ